MKQLIKISILLLLSSYPLSALVFEPLANLSFGVSYAGDTVIVAGDNSCSIMNANPNLGKLRILSAARNQQASLDIFASSDLINGASSIPISLEAYFCSTKNSSSIAINGPTALTLVKSGSNTNLVFIGGTISIGSGASSVIHSTTINVTVTY